MRWDDLPRVTIWKDDDGPKWTSYLVEVEDCESEYRIDLPRAPEGREEFEDSDLSSVLSDGDEVSVVVTYEDDGGEAVHSYLFGDAEKYMAYISVYTSVLSKGHYTEIKEAIEP